MPWRNGYHLFVFGLDRGRVGRARRRGEDGVVDVAGLVAGGAERPANCRYRHHGHGGERGRDVAHRVGRYGAGGLYAGRARGGVRARCARGVIVKGRILAGRTDGAPSGANHALTGRTRSERAGVRGPVRAVGGFGEGRACLPGLGDLAPVAGREGFNGNHCYGEPAFLLQKGRRGGGNTHRCEYT